MSLARLSRILESHADLLFVIEAVAAAAALLYLGLGLTFIVDEWTLIEWAAAPSTMDLVRPFNGHWIAIPAVTYRVLLETFGLQTYVPFHALAVGVHAATAAALYLLVRRRAGGAIALALGGVFLLFGTGYENLYSAFQVGYVGAFAAGLWAIVLLDATPVPDDRRRAVASTLFTLGLMSASPAVMLLAGALVTSTLRRDFRTLAALSLPVVIFVLWQVTIRVLEMPALRIDVNRSPELPWFVAYGLATAFGGVVGMPDLRVSLGSIAVGVLAGAVALRRGWRPTSALQALTVSVVTTFVAVALTRGEPGIAVASSSRYLYAAAPFVGVFAAEVWSALREGTATPSPRRRLALVAAVSIIEFAFIANVGALIIARGAAREGAADARAAMTVLLGLGGDRCTLDAVATVPEEVVVATMPTPAALRQYVQLFGDPREDVLAGPLLATPDARDIARARLLLCGH